jgi:F-type H+-transporting ATPase subunit epsilon
MPALFEFEVHTPYRLFFSGKAETIVLALLDGEIGIMANHSPFAAPSLSCILRIKDGNGEWRSAFVSDGILEVKDGKFKCVLVAEAAEWPEEIDEERALASKKQAEEALSSTNFRFEVDSAKKKLRHAELRLKAKEALAR